MTQPTSSSTASSVQSKILFVGSITALSRVLSGRSLRRGSRWRWSGFTGWPIGRRRSWSFCWSRSWLNAWLIRWLWSWLRCWIRGWFRSWLWRWIRSWVTCWLRCWIGCWSRCGVWRRAGSGPTGRMWCWPSGRAWRWPGSRWWSWSVSGWLLATAALIVNTSLQRSTHKARDLSVLSSVIQRSTRICSHVTSRHHCIRVSRIVIVSANSAVGVTAAAGCRDGSWFWSRGWPAIAARRLILSLHGGTGWVVDRSHGHLKIHASARFVRAVTDDTIPTRWNFVGTSTKWTDEACLDACKDRESNNQLKSALHHYY
mmetsp:Transcript_40507/g.97767  ORF Transcript_40507/g.97767 Transcript_40507/m.97767 type:complete len:314 (+) Transcript_40507:533-1474(+)